MDNKENGNNLPFKKIDENTVFIATSTASGLVNSYIHLCPQRIREASEIYSVEGSKGKPSRKS